MNYETLGDWCKWLEKNFSNEIMIPKLPVIIRLDGNNFHNWTLGLNKPFDDRLNQLIVNLNLIVFNKFLRTNQQILCYFFF